MGDETPEYGFYQPNVDETGWGAEVNENFSIIDSVLEDEESIQDIVGALIQAAGNISVSYDDANDTLTVDTSALREEEVEDAVAALVAAGSGVTVNYDDGNDTLSIAVDESGLSFYDGSSLTAPVDNQSVSTGVSRIGPGLVKTTYPQDATDPTSDWTEETFSSVQDAVDAVPLAGPGNRPAGKVEVMARGANSSDTDYRENVTVDRDGRIIIEGQGTSTRISSQGGTSAPTLSIDNGDDTQIKSIWIDNPWNDNPSDGDAIQVNTEEVILNRVNVDNTGRYAANMNGARNTVKQCELKDGDRAVLRIDGPENKVRNTIIHDELANGIPVGIEFGDVRDLILSDVYIMLDDGTAAFDYTVTGVMQNTQMTNVYIGPSSESGANGITSDPVDLRGSRSQYRNFVIRNNDLTMANAKLSVFEGHVDGSVTHGDRTIINGVGVNSGNPATGGDWNGSAEFAYKHGATVIDTSGSSPLPRYEAQPDGAGGYEWVEVSVTAA